MKMPELPKRKSGSPKAGGGLKPPAFMSDLFKDMRDRRLIIPAIALLVAIAAVPFMLSSEPEPVVSAPPVVADPDAAALEPGVLAVQEVGVRDFQKRLDSLNRKNPFGDRFVPEKSDTGAGALAPADESGGVGSPGVTNNTPSSPPEDPGTTPPSGTQPGESFVLVPRINVQVGIVGRDQVDSIDNVRAGTVLPGKKAPTVLYLGNTDDSSTAEFIVSKDVTKVGGDGRCEPGPNKCEFMSLEDGEKALLRYAHDGKRYSVKVTNIFFVRVDADEFEAQQE